MPYPDFLIIGAPRSGTTSLYSYLNQHPQIEMSSQKEAGFFHFANQPPDFVGMAGLYGPDLLAESLKRFDRARRLSVVDDAKYRQLWSDNPEVLARGEATPTYLFDGAAAASLASRLPGSKLIVILRNPAERAYSEYLQALRLGLENRRTLEDAVAAEPSDIEEYWWGARRYVRSGFYARNLGRYLVAWPRERVRIYFYEQLYDDVGSLLRDCFAFLGVNPDTEIDSSTRHKTGFVPADGLLVSAARSDGVLKRSVRKVLPWSIRRRLYHAIMSREKAEPPAFSQQTRLALVDAFRDDISRLQQITGRDLGVWLGC